MFSLINKAKSMEMSVKPIEPCKWKQKEIQQKKSQKGKLKRNKKCMFQVCNKNTEDTKKWAERKFNNRRKL